MKILYLVLLFTLGSCMSSFLGLVGMRVPNNQSIITPRSHCDQCKKTLTWFELIPIVGFIINFGKCRHCRTNIPYYMPMNELLLGSSFTYIFVAKDNNYFRITILLTLFLLATMDYFYGIIKPVFLVPAFLILIILQPQVSIINCVAVMICLSAFGYLTKGLGFGDIEILSFLALFLPLYDCLLILLVSSLLCLIVEIIKQNFEHSIKFVPYIYLGTTLILIYQ